MGATDLGKIAIVGSGSVGLFYGGRLAALRADVHFLMRSGFDEARERGIRVYSPELGDIRIEHPKAFLEAHEIGPCDLVIILLKATDNGSLETLLPPLLSEKTALIILQNGLGNEEYLASLHGAERVLGGLCFVCLTRRTPASVDHFGHGMLSIGEFERSPLPRTHRIVDAICRSGIDAKLVRNLATERWRKLVWNIPFNGLAVAEGGLTVDKILADPIVKTRCRALMEETILAAKALGHFIESEFADLQIERTYPMGAYKPSTLQATKANLSVPNLESLYNRLKNLESERV